MKKIKVSSANGNSIKIVFAPDGLNTDYMKKDAKAIADVFYSYLPSGTVDELLEEIKRYREDPK